MKGDSYSTLERRALEPFRSAMRAALAPVLWPLVRFRVSPNFVSLSQIPLGIAAAVLISSLPRVALALFALTLVLDGIDGALARRTGKESSFGSLVDQFSDHTREIIMIAGLAFAGAVNGGLGTLYAFSHPLSNFMLYLGSTRGVRAPVTIKTWMSFYPFLILFLWFGIDYLDISIAVSAGLMFLVSGWQLWALRKRV